MFCQGEAVRHWSGGTDIGGALTKLNRSIYGASSFEPRAQGMKAALPYIDHFLPTYNAQSLQVLVRELARV